MHPALRKCPLFYKTPPFPLFVNKPPIFHFFTKTPPISFPAYVCCCTLGNNRYLLHARPTAVGLLPAGLLLWTHAGTDTVLLQRPCSAYYAGSANNMVHYEVRCCIVCKSSVSCTLYILGQLSLASLRGR